VKIPAHITVHEDGPVRRHVECTLCKVSMSTDSKTLGPHLAASFIVQHAAHTKAGAASGLTAGGKASKAAREALA
jgi:hypothetical protein